MGNGLITDDAGVCRCSWCGTDAVYQKYHDQEWGRPVKDDTRLFEKICLEGFQSGLSWITILRKRENFRAAFDGFNIQKISNYTEEDIERLVQDTGIIRHRGKITSVINNAKQALRLQQEYGSLAAYFWTWEPQSSDRPKTMTIEVLRTLAQTPKSTALSKDLKKRGWSFVGPTTVYAFMQAMGMVNDHIEGCHIRGEIEEIRQSFKRPV